MGWGDIIGIVAGFVAGLVATVLGWFLTERSTRKREKRTEQETAASARALVALEIDQNIEEIITYWTIANKLPIPYRSELQAEILLAQRVAQMVVPVWRREAWASQMPLLVAALSSDELRAAHRIYRQLDRISAIRATLVQLAEQEDASYQTARMTGETGW